MAAIPLILIATTGLVISLVRFVVFILNGLV